MNGLYRLRAEGNMSSRITEFVSFKLIHSISEANIMPMHTQKMTNYARMKLGTRGITIMAKPGPMPNRVSRWSAQQQVATKNDRKV